MSDPTKLKTPAEWTDYLDELLEEAEDASGSENSTRIDNARKALQRFERLSPTFANALDRIALEASIDLAISDTKLRLKQLAQRRQEYTDIRQLLDGVTASMPAPGKKGKPN
jgi:hypothetical protein